MNKNCFTITNYERTYARERSQAVLVVGFNFTLIAVNDMPPRKRSVNVEGSPKVYVDIDDVSWRIKSEVVDEAEQTEVPRSPGKSPYSLRNSPRLPQIVPSEEEVNGYKLVKSFDFFIYKILKRKVEFL